MEYHDRLKKVMQDAGVKNKDLMSACRVSSGAVSQWRSGAVRPKDLVSIAKAVRWDVEELRDYLESGRNRTKICETGANYNTKPYPIKCQSVPVISLVQAGDWAEAADPYQDGGWDTLPCPYKHGDNTFAVEITGSSMSPQFPEGMIIFIDPNRMPENKEFCVAKLTETNQTTFKQFVIEDGQKFLKATNPDWPNKYISINGNCQIIGRLIGVYSKY